MTFDNLEVSVHLNKSEPPSLTMAFYMIQNLIKDVETAAGTKFKNVDMGNSDEFPVLLAGQCRMIKAVYESNAEHITRNQDRLAQLSGVLSDIQRELDQGADISKKICEKEKEYEDILQKSKKLLEDKKAKSFLRIRRNTRSFLRNVTGFPPMWKKWSITTLPQRKRKPKG